MPAQDIPDRLRSRKMPDVVSFRAGPGFRDQVRAAAEVEGVAPGELVRRAVLDRLKEAPAVMTEKERASVVARGGEVLARNIERAAVDDEYRAEIGREVDAARYKFSDHILAARDALDAWVRLQAGRDPDGDVEPEAAVEAMGRLSTAYAEIQAARAVEDGLGRLVTSERGV